MKPNYHPTITAALADIRPFGDFVIVKRLDPAQGLEAPASVLIADPGVSMNARGEVKARTDTGVRRGLVVAVGRGDRLFTQFHCEACGEFSARVDGAKNYRCSCGGRLEIEYNDPERLAALACRCEMHVKPGDEVFYQFWGSNVVTIEDQEYQFVHEEQSILAVLEPDEAAA